MRNVFTIISMAAVATINFNASGHLDSSKPLSLYRMIY